MLNPESKLGTSTRLSESCIQSWGLLVCLHIMFSVDKFSHAFVLRVSSKKREVVPELAPMLWHSFGTIAALLQEIINIYPAINPPHLTVSTCVPSYKPPTSHCEYIVYPAVTPHSVSICLNNYTPHISQLVHVYPAINAPHLTVSTCVSSYKPPTSHWEHVCPAINPPHLTVSTCVPSYKPPTSHCEYIVYPAVILIVWVYA